MTCWTLLDLVQQEGEGGGQVVEVDGGDDLLDDTVLRERERETQVRLGLCV